MWLKYCKRTRLTIDELMIIAQDLVLNHRASIFKYIYMRERERHPEKNEGEIRKKMSNKFIISEKSLQKYIYN